MTQATADRVEAEASEARAIQAKKSAEESSELADKAVQDAVASFERARSFVERVQRQASSGQGAWWWTSKEITESKKFVPQKMLRKLDEAQGLNQ